MLHTETWLCLPEYKLKFRSLERNTTSVMIMIYSNKGKRISHINRLTTPFLVVKIRSDPLDKLPHNCIDSHTPSTIHLDQPLLRLRPSFSLLRLQFRKLRVKHIYSHSQKRKLKVTKSISAAILKNVNLKSRHSMFRLRLFIPKSMSVSEMLWFSRWRIWKWLVFWDISRAV
jgi:hypothetical protein